MSEAKIRTRNNDIICVLEYALDICSQLSFLQKKWNTEFLYFKIPSETDYHSTDGQFSAELLQCIYRSIPQKDDSRNSPITTAKIVLMVMDAEKSRTETLNQKTNIRSIVFDGLQKEHDIYLEKLLEEIDGIFLPPEKLESLKEKIQCFLNRRKRLAHLQSPFPGYRIMDGYLQSYYQLLTFYVLNERMIKALGTDMLHLLLQLDSNEYSISLLSPVSLNRLRRMYLGIETYYRKILNTQSQNGVMDLFYQSVIKQKVLQSFRWFVNGDNGELEHVAVSPFAEEESNEPKRLELKIMRTDIHQYNSYEGVGEMRIAEKILYEMEKCSESLKNPPVQFRVAILGDVNIKPIEELDAYLNGVLSAQSNNYKPKMVFDIYTKNNFGDFSYNTNIEMNYYSNLDEIFTSREQMSQLLQEHEVVFMMDCIKLYYEVEYIFEMSSEYLKQRFAFGGALDNATEDKIDICCPNLLDKLYGLLTVYDRCGELGRFSKRANDTLLKFCEEQIQLADENYHTLYVYVSDLSAFNNIYCNDKYYVRTERYNQKEIGIIRYTNHESEKLSFPIASETKEKMLCFNVWQIIKHISLEKRKAVIEAVIKEIDCLYEETIRDYDLHCMHIGIDYSDWPRCLTLHYAVVDDSSQRVQTNAFPQKAFLKVFVEKVIEPIFNQPREELFQKYIWKTIYSLLYGAAKNVEEMVLIHLLQDKSLIVGKTVVAVKNDPVRVEKNINRKYKYSIKRFVAMIISRFDISESNALDQMWAAYIINKSDEAANNKEKLFYKVRIACENMGYVDSYLYQNCINVK